MVLPSRSWREPKGWLKNHRETSAFDPQLQRLKVCVTIYGMLLIFTIISNVWSSFNVYFKLINIKKLFIYWYIMIFWQMHIMECLNRMDGKYTYSAIIYSESILIFIQTFKTVCVIWLLYSFSFFPSFCCQGSNLGFCVYTVCALPLSYAFLVFN